MALEQCKDLFVCWANHLDVVQIHLFNLSDVVTSNFLIEFAKVQKNSNIFEVNEIVTNEDAILYLKSIYPLVDCCDLTEDEDVIFLITLFLLNLCLYNEHPQLRSKLCSLSDNHQYLFRSFLEPFIEVPVDQITKTFVLSQLNKLNLGPMEPLTVLSHLRPAERTLSLKKYGYHGYYRNRKLKAQIDILKAVQAELQDQLDRINQSPNME